MLLACGLAPLALVSYTDHRLSQLFRLFIDGVLELGVLAVPITIFAALGVINAFNMIDILQNGLWCDHLVRKRRVNPVHHLLHGCRSSSPGTDGFNGSTVVRQNIPLGKQPDFTF